MVARKVWFGSEIEECNICHKQIQTHHGSQFVDGTTIYGPWAIMCIPCFRNVGRGLGTGVGQKYEYEPASKEWVKVGG